MNLSESLPEQERPRECLLRHGAIALETSELLAIALRTGACGRNVIELSRLLLDRFGGLCGLFSSTPQELQHVPGLGQAKACLIVAILELARRAIEEDMIRSGPLSDLAHVKHYCKTALGHLKVEHCIALYLDNQLNLIATSELARGTLSQACVYPREVAREALKHHAAALILAHNHPSGRAAPSKADIAFTQHLKQALALINVRLVDHLVVANDYVTSLAEQGHM